MSLNSGWETRALEFRPRVAVFINATAAVTVAKSKGSVLGINAEANRLARQYPGHVSHTDLTEFMTR